MDAVVPNYFGEGARVWVNDGGQFTTNGQVLGTGLLLGVSLGDLDGDGDLDAFFARIGSTNHVFFDPQTGPPPRLSIVTADSIKPEGNSGNALFTFTVTRSGNTTAAASVDYVVTGTGTNPADAVDFGGTLPSGTVNFASGETNKTITVVVAGDTEAEADEGFVVALSNPQPGTAQILAATANGTILNDDTPPSTVTLSVDNTTIPEANGVATLTATLSAPVVATVTVDFEVSGGAQLDIDYVLSSTRIVIAAGNTTGSVTVTSVQDAVDEPDETIVVSITSVTGAVESGTQQQVVTIADGRRAAGADCCDQPESARWYAWSTDLVQC